MAANLALLQSAGQVKFSNIGSAHLTQSSPAVAQQGPSEPTSFGFSFSAMGESLAAVATDTSNTETPSATTQDHRLPEGFFGAF